MENQKVEPSIKVSDEFMYIYRNFNVSDQIENMKKLNREELYLLLFSCIDRQDEDDSISMNNYEPFEKEIDDILLWQENQTTTIPEILNLQVLLDQRISTDKMELPDPYTKEEVRDLKLHNILDK